MQLVPDHPAPEASGLLRRGWESLVGRFAVSSLVVFVGVGSILMMRVSSAVEERLIQEAELRADSLGRAAQSVFTVLHLGFPKPGEEPDPRLGEAIAALGPQIAPLQEASFLVREADGDLRFTTDERLAQSRPSEFTARLPETISVIDDNLNLLRTQIPIQMGDGSDFLVEVAQDYGPIAEATVNERRQAGLVLALGLAVLYLALLPLLRSAAQRLRDQAVELRESLAREQEKSEKLRELDDMKNAFLSAASHELRTPLTILRGGSQLLGNRYEQMSPDQREQIVVAIDTHAMRMERVVTDLVNVDRLMQGTVKARRREVDLAKIVGGIADRHIASGGNVMLDAEPSPAEVDIGMVERIMDQLLRNALKYTEAGSPVVVAVETREDGWLMTVDDHGPGIPESKRASIFDALTRLDDGHPSPGLGVGLAMVARYAEAHGGWADVVEAPGGGARFRVFLGVKL